ncbi:MAG: tyrosine-type recombinase/integrase [Deltaproteobacteria bacterium]|jgi:integrase|nr:tyrosine-type recombinase/integrase [Deltaproteobacteria bacterium]
MKVKDYLNEYIHESRGRLSQASIERYQRSYKALNRFLGDFELKDLSSRVLTKFACQRLEDGLKPESVNIDLRHIKAALKRAERWELIDKPVFIEMVKTPKRIPRHLSESEFRSIIEAESYPKFRRLWIFLLWTAVRRNEALNLTWERVFYGDNPHIRVVGKGDVERVVPLLPPAIKALGKHRRTGLVFHFKNPTQVTKHFKVTAQKAGLGEHRLHDLRHTGITRMVGQGLPLKLVQEFAGHATILTTMNYAKIFSGDSYKTLMKAFGFKDGAVKPGK